MTIGQPRPLRRGIGQVAGVGIALTLVGTLGVVEAHTPPSITVGAFLLILVLAATWLFSPLASLLVSAAAVTVPLVAWRVGADDPVAAEIEAAAIVVLSAAVTAAIRAIERYGDLLARRNRELVDVNASLENFTADAAHEFRAPLAVVLSEVDLALARAGSADDYRRHLVAIRGEVSQMHRSISGLLTLARADSGSLQTTFRRIDLVDLCELLLARWRPLFTQKVVVLHGSLPDAGELTCDPDLLTRVIDNLLDNALRAVSPGGTVELATRRDGDDWLLVVTDTGPGVAAGTIATLLHGRSLRPAPASRDTGGSGFGLALCAAIVRAHRGSIRVDSSHRGASFTVRLPAGASPD